MYQKGIKRILDFILALSGLIVLSPIFIFLCIWIKLDSKGPVLFKQKRVGINKTYFNILKFRTMYIDTPKDMPTHMLKDPDQFITKAGKFLRKTSLDVRPGLTGWAQINGRDELEIPVKATLDGEYVKRISFLFDLRCFFGTIASVLKSDGVVEGGTGSMKGEGQ